MMQLQRLLSAVCLVFSALPGFALESLPQPLTLEQALALSDFHPSVQIARSAVDQALAEADKVSSDSGFKISAQGYLTAIEPSSVAIRSTHDDSKALLLASKKLYDFGYTRARETAAENLVKSQQWHFLNQRQQHQLNVVKLFFAVLLSDKNYVLMDEEMTLAYLQYDKARDRHELGKVSDIALLELENGYREKLQLRKVAEQEQRLSRLRLATALGRPNDLPSELVQPEIDWHKQIPSIEKVTEKSLANNPELLTLREAVTAARENLAAAQARYNPVIHGEMLLGQYARPTNSTHDASASLVLEVPLYTGGSSDAEIAGARAYLTEQELRLQDVELSIRQAAVEMVLQLESLKADLEAQKVNEAFTELYLDKNRALYELEVASDFGDATVRVSRVILKKLEVLLEYALVQAKLAALQGEWLDSKANNSMVEAQ